MLRMYMTKDKFKSTMNGRKKRRGIMEKLDDTTEGRETRRDMVLSVLDTFYCTPRFADVLADDIFFYDANR